MIWRNTNNNRFLWLLACAVIVCESWKPQSWLLHCLRLLTEVSTSAVSMSPEWIIRCFQCHTTLLTFTPAYSAPPPPPPWKHTPGVYRWDGVCVGVHAGASNWWRGKEGRWGRFNPPILLPFPSVLPSGPPLISLQKGEGEKWSLHRPRH